MRMFDSIEWIVNSHKKRLAYNSKPLKSKKTSGKHQTRNSKTICHSGFTLNPKRCYQQKWNIHVSTSLSFYAQIGRRVLPWQL